MNIPEELRYTNDHEWARFEEDTMTVTIGVTDWAQSRMGDVVYVELPQEDDEVESSEPFGSVESVKAVSDLFSPVTGMVMEVNDALVESPEVVNDDPYGEAWLIRVKVENDSEFKKLMSAEDYKEFVAKEEEDD